jgi:hypothetical protein
MLTCFMLAHFKYQGNPLYINYFKLQVCIDGFFLSPRAGESPMHFARSSLFILVPFLCCAGNFSHRRRYRPALLLLSIRNFLNYMQCTRGDSFTAWALFLLCMGRVYCGYETLGEEMAALNCKIKCV